jgi:hypothetical protein
MSRGIQYVIFWACSNVHLLIQVQRLAGEVGLHETLNQLLSCSFGWMNETIRVPQPSPIYLDEALFNNPSPSLSTVNISRRSVSYFRSLCLSKVPSEGAVAAAAVSALAAFAYNSDRCKRLIAKSGNAKLSLLDSGFHPDTTNTDESNFLGTRGSSEETRNKDSTRDKGHGNALTLLTMIGLSSSIVPQGKHLCLSLLASIVLVENSAAVIEKNVIGQQLASCLQRGSLLRTSQFDSENSPTDNRSFAASKFSPASKQAKVDVSLKPEHLFYLIGAWSACLTSTTYVDTKGALTAIMDSRHQAGRTVDPSCNRSYVCGGSGSGSSYPRDVHNDVESAKMSVPEMLSWLYEKYVTKTTCGSIVGSQIVRAIGCFSAGPSIMNPHNMNALTTNNSVSYRRMISNAASSNCLAILADSLERVAITGSQTETSATMSCGLLLVTLWTLFHASEQAKSNWKQLINDFPARVRALFEKYHYSMDVNCDDLEGLDYMDKLERLVDTDVATSDQKSYEQERIKGLLYRALLALTVM